MLIKRNESGKHPIIVTDYQPCSDQKTFQFDYWPLLIIFQEWTREALLAIKAYLEKKDWFGQGCEHGYKFWKNMILFHFFNT